MPNRAAILKQKYQDSLGLPFAQVLSDRAIQQVLEDQNVRYRQVLYTPIVVLWAWISQVVDPDKSLSHAVKRITTWLATSGETIPSSDTGGYSKARKRLPFAVLPPLLAHTADALHASLPPIECQAFSVTRQLDSRVGISVSAIGNRIMVLSRQL